MMTDTPRLTPELVVMAIQAGMLDDSLPALQDVIRKRKEVVADHKAATLTPGTRFLVKDIRPKKYEGLTVTFVKYEGMWLVCHMDDIDTRRINNMSPSYPTELFRTIKLRTSHVGTIFPPQA